MDKLIDKKFIERVRCEQDRRVVYVTITQAGLDLLDQMDEQLNAMDDFMSRISLQEAEILNNLLDKLRES
jgi:MarR family transcriptional regulator, 2-MHQ and catechol-resistance regulon repressor